MIVRNKKFDQLEAILGTTGLDGSDSSEHYIMLRNLGGFIWDVQEVKTDMGTNSVRIGFKGDGEFLSMMEALISITNKMLDVQKV